MKIEIDVYIPDDWEFVAYRAASHGEHYLCNGSVMQAVGCTYSEVIVIHRTWQWPPWLKANYIAMDEDGVWWGYKREPQEIGGFRWTGEINPVLLDTDWLDFTPPPCDDWKSSKRKRPDSE